MGIFDSLFGKKEESKENITKYEKRKYKLLKKHSISEEQLMEVLKLGSYVLPSDLINKEKEFLDFLERKDRLDKYTTDKYTTLEKSLKYYEEAGGLEPTMNNLSPFKKLTKKIIAMQEKEDKWNTYYTYYSY